MKAIFGAAAAGLNSNKNKGNGRGFNLALVLGVAGAVSVPIFAVADHNAVMPALEAAASTSHNISVALLEAGGDVEAHIAASDAENEELDFTLISGGNDADPADLCIEVAWADTGHTASHGEGC